MRNAVSGERKSAAGAAILGAAGNRPLRVDTCPGKNARFCLIEWRRPNYCPYNFKQSKIGKIRNLPLLLGPITLESCQLKIIRYICQMKNIN